MIAVVQRVSRASVRVAGETVGEIGAGLLVLVAIERDDGDRHLDWLSAKVVEMRVFNDSDGRMNRSALDVGADLLIVSQFTLAGDLSRGRRPGFEDAAPPETARTLFDGFVERLRRTPLKVETGRFREHMDVELVNDGPVTFVLRHPAP
ncbi:MAG TPA: D-aminoacyl-tRNA deacylase [Candidatus Polarisedimenticolia bacterium]|jgi:D-tyrosyl-tRNA(Tyr) deacylase|nr:D-aminoacyl-tRNA deacylase [Candidatus Polarisedimenticolia bacterium]